MRMLRGLGIAAGVAMALVVQVSVLPHLAWRGIVPDLGLLVVVAAGLARDERFAMVVGFGTGLLLDLTPPADHMAGRWTLALVIVGYVAGLARQEAPPTRPALAAMVAVSSVVGSSVFALTGLVLSYLEPDPDLVWDQAQLARAEATLADITALLKASWVTN